MVAEVCSRGHDATDCNLTKVTEIEKDVQYKRRMVTVGASGTVVGDEDK